MRKPRQALRQPLLQQSLGGSLHAIRVLHNFDTAGAVSFAGMSALTNPVFRLVLNVNRAYFGLRQQYHFW
jgi:hypothetical protein